MYEIKKYGNDLDLSFFYQRCQEKGFLNNASQKRLIDSFSKQKYFNLWILFYDNLPVGSTAVHDFDEVMGENSYRICVRTCALTELLPIKHMRTKDGITKHQNICSQIFIPVTLNALPKDSKCYITSSNKDEASMQKVNGIWAKLLSKQGVIKKVKDVFYRGANQTVWQLNTEEFMKQIDRHTKWEYQTV